MMERALGPLPEHMTRKAWLIFLLPHFCVQETSERYKCSWLVACLCHYAFCSRGAEKYFRRGGRLNWPEGANSRESIRAVKRLDRLKVVHRYYVLVSIDMSFFYDIVI